MLEVGLERSFLDFAVEEDFKRTGECNLRIAREEFFPAGFGWIHQKGDDVGKLFNREFILMQQTGLFAKWKLQYWPKENMCTNGRSRSVMQALDIQDMAGSFVVLGSGFVFGIFLLATECCCKSRGPLRAPKRVPPKPRGKTEPQELTVDEISEKDLKPYQAPAKPLPSPCQAPAKPLPSPCQALSEQRR
ncbi:uncharacterized protein LOC122264082 [Penaeus japonicus]|uniref:uncharacterized protein LOC122264082 n=1 Tax=Penaeus japonicus TaxID=27405 RepID=UPI001C70F4A8|nr:uncharacterized protein LOC122264082 [Penaeus japonicus]